MRIFYYFLTCYMLLMPYYAMGHEKFEYIKGIRGEYAITSDSETPPVVAKEKARENAKREALIQAFGQYISIVDKIEISSAGESFSSMNVLQNNGEIEEFKIIKEDFYKHPNRANEMVFYCIADVKVRKGVEPDPSFVATISGIKATYLNDQILTFNITPTKNAYLKVFLFENSETGKYVYPGGVNHGLFIEADKTTGITRSVDQDIYLLTEKNRETNVIVILLTKDECPFNIANPTRQDIDKFIARIPNNKKYVSYHIVDIIK